MVTNFETLKENLSKKGEALVDKTLFESDLKYLYDYYRENPEDRSDQINRLFSDPNFGFNQFLTAFTSIKVGTEVQTEITEDGWLRIISR